MQGANSDAELEREIQTLKAAFEYRCFQHDLDFLYEDLERVVFSKHHLAGRSINTFATEFLLDCYYAQNALEPLVKIYAEQGYRTASRFERLLNQLQGAGRFDLIEKFWLTITRLTRAEYLAQRHSRSAFVQEFKGYAVESYQQAILWLEKVGKSEAVQQMKTQQAALDQPEPTAPPVSDPRKLDESVYWSLINASAADAATPIEQIVSLGESLRAFKAAEIKRFAALYAKQMKALYHWNVWALAYIARGGCSDSAFEGFRTWLILQGNPDLLLQAVNAPDKAALQIPKNPHLPDANLLWVTSEAYYHRAGEPMSLPTLDLSKPKGKPWTEDKLAKIYPALHKYYSE